MVTQLIVPYWFRMRQGKIEAAGENQLKLTAPNLPDWFIGVRQDDMKQWRGLLRSGPDGEDAAVTEHPYADANDAWYAAFELYRTHVVV